MHAIGNGTYTERDCTHHTGHPQQLNPERYGTAEVRNRIGRRERRKHVQGVELNLSMRVCFLAVGMGVDNDNAVYNVRVAKTKQASDVRNEQHRKKPTAYIVVNGLQIGRKDS